MKILEEHHVVHRMPHVARMLRTFMNAADFYTVSDSGWDKILNDFHTV